MRTTQTVWLCLRIRKIYSGDYPFETRQFPWARAQVYYFGTDSESLGDRPSRTHSTIGLRAYDPPEVGQYDFDTESVVQFGKFNGRDHLAHFHPYFIRLHL